MEGPKVNIPPRMGGVVTATEKPYRTMDHLLYKIRWDNGQVSKHYYRGFFCIGRFESRDEFEGAIRLEGQVQLTVGPGGGFRSGLMRVVYDGESREGRLTQQDRDLWVDFLEPLAKRQKVEVLTTKLPPANRKKT
jgi:hypothetical protein